MEISIRPMIASDIPILAAWMTETPLWQRYGLSVERAIANFEAGLKNGDWLLTADGEAAAQGFAWAMVKGAFGRSPYLRLIGVRPDAVGSGIGAGLLDAVERMAVAVSNDLFLLVSDFNHDAQRFYQRHGYQQIGSIPAYMLPDVSELIFRKRFK
jgi:ribosomal protein S18 acetylase RimI-like enzyme